MDLKSGRLALKGNLRLTFAFELYFLRKNYIKVTLLLVRHLLRNYCPKEGQVVKCICEYNQNGRRVVFVPEPVAISTNSSPLMSFCSVSAILLF